FADDAPGPLSRWPEAELRRRGRGLGLRWRCGGLPAGPRADGGCPPRARWAARRAPAGKRVAVLERGREFVTGEFPGRFPELREQLQVTGRRLRMGAPTRLYDLRLGEGMHV